MPAFCPIFVGKFTLVYATGLDTGSNTEDGTATSPLAAAIAVSQIVGDAYCGV